MGGMMNIKKSTCQMRLILETHQGREDGSVYYNDIEDSYLFKYKHTPKNVENFALAMSALRHTKINVEWLS